MELGYPNSWAEGQTRALEAFQQDAPNAPAPVEEIPPHLPADRQCFCLAHFYQPLHTPIYLPLSYLLWLIQKWVQPGPTRAAQSHDLETWVLSRNGNIPGHPYSTADNKNSQAVAQSPHQPKACRQHFWKCSQAGSLHLLVWGWGSQGGRWPLCWQLQPWDVAGHDWHWYIPTPGSRCTVNKTVFPTEPAEQYILYSNEVIIKIGNYWNNRINFQSLKSS